MPDVYVSLIIYQYAIGGNADDPPETISVPLAAYASLPAQVRKLVAAVVAAIMRRVLVAGFVCWDQILVLVKLLSATTATPLPHLFQRRSDASFSRRRRPHATPEIMRTNARPYRPSTITVNAVGDIVCHQSRRRRAYGFGRIRFHRQLYRRAIYRPRILRSQSKPLSARTSGIRCELQQPQSLLTALAGGITLTTATEHSTGNGTASNK